jgi:hypothetical protein
MRLRTILGFAGTRLKNLMEPDIISVIKIKEDEMDETCSMHGGGEKLVRTKSLSGNLKGQEKLGKVGIHGRILLKCILHKFTVCLLDSAGSG